jgi:hypothetical protein
MGRTKALKIIIDGQIYTYNGSNADYSFQVNKRTLSVTPKLRYWMPGMHYLQVYVNDTVIANQTFVTQWEIDFTKKNATILINPLDKMLCRGQATLESKNGLLVLAPSAINLANPSYVKTPVFTKDLSNYEVAICFKVPQPKVGGFQVTLPGALSVQVGDGDLKFTTVKIETSYIGKNNMPNQIKKADALLIPYPGSSVRMNEEWIWICNKNNCLTIYSGLDKSESLCDIDIDPAFLKNENRQLIIRSYGSIVTISKIIVNVSECIVDK